MIFGLLVNVLHTLFQTDEEILISLVFKDLLINEIFSTLSSDEDRYELNQFLIENVEKSISKDRRFNGVVFISTKDAPGVNFAIYGEAIKDLKLSNVNLIEITSIDDYGCIGYKHLESSSSEDGNLHWDKDIHSYNLQYSSRLRYMLCFLSIGRIWSCLGILFLCFITILS
jgi:hypothetical protein